MILAPDCSEHYFPIFSDTYTNMLFIRSSAPETTGRLPSPGFYCRSWAIRGRWLSGRSALKIYFKMWITQSYNSGGPEYREELYVHERSCYGVGQMSVLKVMMSAFHLASTKKHQVPRLLSGPKTTQLRSDNREKPWECVSMHVWMLQKRTHPPPRTFVFLYLFVQGCLCVLVCAQPCVSSQVWHWWCVVQPDADPKTSETLWTMNLPRSGHTSLLSISVCPMFSDTPDWYDKTHWKEIYVI